MKFRCEHDDPHFDTTFERDMDREPSRVLPDLSRRKPLNENGSIRSEFAKCTAAGHEQLKSSPAWPRLKLIGYMPELADDSDRVVAVLELRNCDLCKSSLAKRLEPTEAALTYLRMKGLL